MNYYFIKFIFFLLFIPLGCFSQKTTKYTISDGPEDFVVDSFSSTPRLIISCHNRRDTAQKGKSYFYSFDIQSKAIKKNKRKNEPENLKLNLIGIDIEKINENIFLYATNYRKFNHCIIKYLLKGDSLTYIKSFKSPFIYKPNDVAVYHGNFIVSQCKYINGSIVYCDSTGNCKEIKRNVNFPNGVYLENDTTFYYSSTLDNLLMKGTINSSGIFHKTKIRKIKGADNILVNGDDIYITSHPRFIKFLKHTKHENKKSPIAIYRITKGNKKSKKIYSDNGKNISAASSAIVYKNKLYISQIFNDYILEVELE